MYWMQRTIRTQCNCPSPKIILIVNFRRITRHRYLQCNVIIPVLHSFSLLSLLCLCFNMQELLFCLIFKALMKPITHFRATFKAADKMTGQKNNVIPLSFCTPLHRNIYVAFHWSFPFRCYKINDYVAWKM